MVKDEAITLPRGTKVPDHIAIILDGNRRWARARGLKPWEGHRAGYEAVKRMADASRKLGVHTFTVWAWSTENWERAEVEVNEIFKLLRVAIAEMDEELKREKVRFVHIGRKDRLPKDVLEGLKMLEDKSRMHTEHTFNLCLDYGGKDEILRATRRIISDQLPVEQIDEKIFESYLDTAGQQYPYVDLFIRTSGEQRTSGLLPWQMTYAEYYFEQDHLPDFTPAKLREAILDFSRRRRRFGGDDAVEHFQFDPKVVAKIELDMRRQIGDREKLSELAIEYIKQQYGMSKNLAKVAGLSLAKALVHRDKLEWDKARQAMTDLYELIRKNVGLALEPEIVASIEVGTWKGQLVEGDLRQLLAEKFRVSEFQAAKSAHLAYMANEEVARGDWKKAGQLMEKYYQALKERVA